MIKTYTVGLLLTHVKRFSANSHLPKWYIVDDSSETAFNLFMLVSLKPILLEMHLHCMQRQSNTRFYAERLTAATMYTRPYVRV